MSKLGIISFLIFFLTLAAIYAIFAIGTNISWGGAGLFNVSIHGMMLIGAYTTAILTTAPTGTRFGGFGFPFIVGVLGAMLVSVLASLVFIPFALRLKDSNYFALGCLGFAEIMRLIAIQEDGLTQGPMGIGMIPQPFREMFNSRFSYNLFFLLFAIGILILVYFLMEKLIKSPWGRVLRSIREDENVSISLGKNTFKYKIQTLMISSMIYGLGGALLAHFYTYITPDNFMPIYTFIVWIMIISGGVGNNLGAIAGAVVIRLAWEGTIIAVDYLPPALATRMGDIRLFIIGLVLIVVMLSRPVGLFPEKKRVSRYIKHNKFFGTKDTPYKVK
ncbi:MAG: branched-chain amino acid ABC transporter permease [Halanaerobiales bacterium]